MASNSKFINFTFILIFTLCSNIALANDITIVHKGFNTNLLPEPGYPFKISAEVNGVHELDGKMELIASFDNEMNIISHDAIEYAESNNPRYLFEVNAPLASLSYFFIYTNSDGKNYLSQRFSNIRECMPKIILPEIKENDITGKSKARSRLLNANKLDKEVTNLDQVLVILNKIKTEIEK